jgi:hypothetical protein
VSKKSTSAERQQEIAHEAPSYARVSIYGRQWLVAPS